MSKTIKQFWDEARSELGLSNACSHEGVVKHWRVIAINSQNRYEELLELLPQDLSNPDTDPKYVAEGVERNTLDKSITQDDVKMLLDDYDSLEDLKSELIRYFDIEVDE